MVIGVGQGGREQLGSANRRVRAISVAAWLGPWISLAALSFWTSLPGSTWLLAVAAIGVTAPAVVTLSRPRLTWVFGSCLLVVGILLGFVGHQRVEAVLTDFEGYWAQRDTAVGTLLEEELDRRVELGLAATQALADEWEDSGNEISIDILTDIRNRYESSSLALYDAEGQLILWDGVHRGRVPEDVQVGTQEFAYHDSPLFGYLYVTSKAADGGVAVAAHLIRSALPDGLGADVGDLASDFYEETSERIRIVEADSRPLGGIGWGLPGGDSSSLTAIVDRPSLATRATQVMDLWSSRVALLILITWVLLALGGPRHVAGAIVAASVLVFIAVWLPLTDLLPFVSFMNSEAFASIQGSTSSLPRYAVISMTVFAFVSVLPHPRIRPGPWTVGIIVGLGFPILLGLVWAGIGPSLIAYRRLDWIVYEMGTAALLSLVAGSALVLSKSERGSPFAGLSALGITLCLSAGGAAWVWFTASHPLWWTILWAIPASVAVLGVQAWSGWQRNFVAWGLGITIGSAAAIPITWSHSVEAQMQAGEERLEGLAAFEDPELENFLLRFGAVADSLHSTGSDDVTVLYNAWRLSGLADFGHPVGLQIWRRDGSPELRIGVEGGEPEPLGEALAESWRTGGVRLLHLNRDDARYILTSRLANENVVSVVAPPFVRSAERSGLGPLLLGPRAEEGDPLTVIPLLVGDSHPDEGFQWSRVSDGWQADMLLGFANDMDYHAHYLVSLPGLALAVARATLLLALNLVVFFLFWLIGQGLVGRIGRRDFRLSGRVISFRARVTLSLFGFFTLANALFGTVAYSTLSSASRRSAMVIAERVGEDASGWYRALGGRVDVWERRRTLPLARQVGAELLEYRGGELREASVEELVELGLYEGWTPYEVFSLLESQEVVYGFTETSVGRWEYVTAYRRLPDGDILGAQVPLEAGTSALQATDLIELLGFFVLIGALLSLGLAMFAGRALTQPIRALQIASEKVGAGDLTQRLPENRGDEFGAVFEAFNRMVGRVHQVRRQLVRTSKRTQLIMDEAAVGMVAIDSNGKVTLANPRAEELLDGEVFVGSPLPETGSLAEVLTPWLTSLLKGALEEGGTEFQAGDRRVRVRVRRIGSMGTQPGVVVAMDDVTDELRSERVLAWGEMARQVAHEVKNPLTPIKLSIQHVRRAWKDSHPDFEDILLNNADAMLMEIERLAGIAQSFSSFGAPGGPVVELSRVLIIDVVNDVMALYRSSVGHIQFDANIDPTLPPVVARSSELKEVLVNLLENARMAGRVEGTLVSIVASRDDQEKVLLQVIDDGVGIAADTLPRIFEPQFSTRSAGAGLGLAIVQKLVRSWGGKVSVSSTLGEGTTVSLILRSWESRDVH